MCVRAPFAVDQRRLAELVQFVCAMKMLVEKFGIGECIEVESVEYNEETDTLTFTGITQTKSSLDGRGDELETEEDRLAKNFLDDDDDGLSHWLEFPDDSPMDDEKMMWHRRLRSPHKVGDSHWRIKLIQLTRL